MKRRKIEKELKAWLKNIEALVPVTRKKVSRSIGAFGGKILNEKFWRKAGKSENERKNDDKDKNKRE